MLHRLAGDVAASHPVGIVVGQATGNRSEGAESWSVGEVSWTPGAGTVGVRR